jgi:hypothetical protein
MLATGDHGFLNFDIDRIDLYFKYHTTPSFIDSGAHFTKSSVRPVGGPLVLSTLSKFHSTTIPSRLPT